MPALTALDTIAPFDEGIRSQLATYWITSAEEFVSTARSGNQQHGSGLVALSKALTIPQERVRELVMAAQTAMPAGTSFDVGVELHVGDGAIFEGMQAVPAPSFAVPITLPEKVEPPPELPLPQQQGIRHTCVAFTLVAMYQHATGDTSDLSEQFLYWACKEYDGIPTIKGTLPDKAMAVLRDVGVCAETLWPYVAEQQASEGQGPPPDAAVQDAQNRRITGFSGLTFKDVRQIKAALAAGKAVLLGLPIHEHWLGSWQSRTLGKVRHPLPGENTNMGGHAMCAVGYRDDPSAPGGGYFIVRNSWGTTWGSDNLDGAGHAHIPYRVVFDHNLAAFVIDDVVRPASTAPVGRSSTANDLQAIYAEAREIQQRINTLVEQLDNLIGQ